MRDSRSADLRAPAVRNLLAYKEAGKLLAIFGALAEIVAKARIMRAFQHGDQTMLQKWRLVLAEIQLARESQ